jgi:hypothetical protein
MSRLDIPITCLIRYRAVARPQLSHFCCPDTTPRVGCLCDCPICVIVTVTTYALVTFRHTKRVCTVQQVMGPASRHSRATTWFGELRPPPLPQKASLHSLKYSHLVVGGIASINCEIKLTTPHHLSQLPHSRGRPAATHTDALVVCGHGAYRSKLETGGVH